MVKLMELDTIITGEREMKKVAAYPSLTCLCSWDLGWFHWNPDCPVHLTEKICEHDWHSWAKARLVTATRDKTELLDEGDK
jgi:hypothetical protein